MTTKIRKQVSEFHKASGQPILDKPEIPPVERVYLRTRLITEEYFEFLEAVLPEYKIGLLKSIKQEIHDYLIEPKFFDVDLVEAADAMGDLDYVIEGTRLEFGIDGEPIMDEIQKSNMAKFGPGSWTDETGKIRKPPNWQAPDIAKILKAQGWGG